MVSKPTRAEVLLLRVALVIASGLFLAGLVMPIATIEQFFIFDSTFSVWSGLWQLATGNQITLFILITLFSLLLPLAKVAVLWRIAFASANKSKARNRWLTLMHTYGRWSMLDVFVVAMLVVAIKLTAIASIETHIGLYIFSGGILLIMAITGRIARW